MGVEEEEEVTLPFGREREGKIVIWLSHNAEHIPGVHVLQGQILGLHLWPIQEQQEEGERRGGRTISGGTIVGNIGPFVT